MARVTVADGKILYRKRLESCEIPIADLVWAYLQQGEPTVKMCGNSMETEAGRVIVVDKNGKKEVFRFESMQEARELLARIQQANPDLAVGYTEENRRRFEG